MTLQAQQIARYEKQIQEQSLLISELLRSNQELLGKATELQEQVAYLIRKLYAHSSEKTAAVFDGQIMLGEFARLFNEAETYADPNIEEPEPFVAPQKKTRAGYNRKEAFSALPEEEMVYKIDEAHRNCPKCGTHLDVVGKKFVRAEVNYIPAQLSILNIYQETCSCPACTARIGQTAFVEPTIPEPVLQHSYASASSVAWTMYQKFVQSVPLYRQEKDWKAMGLDLGRSTLSNWIAKTSEEWLSPVVEHMHRELLKEKYLFADETPVQVLREPHKKDATKSYMWVLANQGRDHPMRVFRYAPSRSGREARGLLNGFSGYLHTDDYAGYNRVPEVKRCLCWAHVRRRFRDAIPKPTTEGDKKLAEIGFAFCNKLFEWERKFSTLDPEDRKKARLEKERPVLDAFWKWVDSILPDVLPNGKLGKALSYTKDNQQLLETYLEDGHCAISNNLAENCVRPFTVGRKNWEFAGSPKGADASACVYSLVETAKANNLDPFHYLQCLLLIIPGSKFRTDEKTMQNLMPWSPFMQSQCNAN